MKEKRGRIVGQSIRRHASDWEHQSSSSQPSGLTQSRKSMILPVRHRKGEQSMSETATTTLSSKGQVVIPEEIRARLGLKPGAQFVVVGDRDVVIFKVLEPPSLSEFEALATEARRAGKRVGLRPSDVRSAVRKVRRSR